LPRPDIGRPAWLALAQAIHEKLPFAFVLFALALSGCGEKKLSLTEIRNPTSSMLGQTIVTRGI